MTTEQTIKYETTLIDEAKNWANGHGEIQSQEHLCIVAAHVNLNLPSCFHHFVSSSNPDSCCATGAMKTILKYLKILQRRLLHEV